MKLATYIIIIGFMISQTLNISSSTLFPVVEDFTGRSGFLSTDDYYYGTNKNSIPLTSDGLRLLNRENSRGSYVMHTMQQKSADQTGFSTYFKFKVQHADADGLGILFADAPVTGIGPIGGAISYPPVGPNEDFAVLFDWWGGRKIEFIQRVPGTQSREHLLIYNRETAALYNTLHVWIDYEFSEEGGTLFVYHAGTNVRPENPSMTRNVTESFTRDGVYFGVLAATGGATMLAYLQEKIIADRFIASSINVENDVTTDQEAPTLSHHITETSPNHYQITLSAIDPPVTFPDGTVVSGSGLKSLDYSVNGSDYLPYNGTPINIDAAGTLEYRAIDEFNNVTSQALDFYRFDWVKRSTHLTDLESVSSLVLPGTYQDLADFESAAVDSEVTFDGITYQFKGWYADPYFINSITDVTITANTHVYGKYIQTYAPVREIPANTSSGSITITPSALDYFVLDEFIISNGGFNYTYTQSTIQVDLIDANQNTDYHIFTNGAIVSYHAFSVETDPKKWHDAKKYCEDEGGYLATVTSLAEWRFILKILPNQDEYWLGGTDEAKEGTWQWVNDEGQIPLSGSDPFQAWAIDEPNNSGGQDHLLVWKNNKAKGEDYIGWDDQDGTSKDYPFVCEYETKQFYSSSSDLEIIESHTLTHFDATLDLKHSDPDVTFEIAEGSVLSDIPEPTREGYTFAGWYENSGLTTSVNQATMSAATTLYAKWGAQEYAIDYRLTVDPSITTITNANIQTFKSDESVSLISPEAIGFVFEGWFNTLNYVGTSISAIQSGTTRDQLLYAKWSAVPSNIIFNNTYGDSVDDINAGFADGFILPELERPGYTFDGWLLDGVPFTQTLVPLGETVLTDAWSVNSTTLTLESNGGSVVDSITQAYESTLTLPTPRRQGFTFNGWFLDGTRVAYTTMPLNDQTLTARWTANTYTLSLSNNVNSDQSSIKAAYQSSINLPVPSIDGYTFKGWFENGTAVTYRRMPLGNKSLRAIFEANTYTIQFSTGDAASIEALEAPYQSSIQLPRPSLENHAFDGWFMNGSKVNLTTMPLNGATLTAQFTPLESTITFVHPNGDAPSPVTDLIGDPIHLPRLTKNGYTFDGWFLDGALVDLSEMPETDVTLTAQFTINAYTLTFIGFDGAVHRTVTADFNSVVSIPSLEQRGYLLNQWTLNGTRVLGNSLRMPAGGGTLVAEFLPILYPITMVHKSSVVTVDAPFNSTVEFPVSNATGYAFTGWMHNDQMITSLNVPLNGTTVTAVYRPYETTQTLYTPYQTLNFTLTTDALFDAPSIQSPDTLLFNGYFTQPFGLGERFTASDRIRNALEEKAYPHVFNPSIARTTESKETLSTGLISRSVQNNFLAPPPTFNWLISLLFWGGGLITLAVLHERGRSHG